MTDRQTLRPGAGFTPAPGRFPSRSRAEADDEGLVRDTSGLAPGPYTVIVTAVGYGRCDPGPGVRGRFAEFSGPVDLDLARLGTGADPSGGQVVQVGIAAIGTTPRVEPEVQAVQGGSPPGA
ncbi:hypothetical protein [Streptomyces sp. YKOK-I1]